jgi:two-component system chemotaxis response regulator CheY
MKLRALVVDDSRVMRNLVIQSIRNTELADFEFIEAEDGSDALTKFNPKTIDIMFVDWNMPKITGIEFVRKVRATGKTEHIPIVMVTSERSIGKIEEALDQAGANEYITKPFGADELARKLSKLVRGIPAQRTEDAAGTTAGFFGKLFGGG